MQEGTNGKRPGGEACALTSPRVTKAWALDSSRKPTSAVGNSYLFIT
jgi:hypothetical protein